MGTSHGPIGYETTFEQLAEVIRMTFEGMVSERGRWH